MFIYSISGCIGSGKDTVANYLVREYGFLKFSFACALKDIISNIFSWDRILLEGLTVASRDWRNTVDDWWSEKLNIEKFTPRMAMEIIGTDLFRDQFCKELWLIVVERRIMNIFKNNSKKNIVISDARFINEIEFIRKIGGKTVMLSSHNNPVWFESAKEYLGADETTKQKMKSDMASYPFNIFSMKIHESEWQWVNYDFDIILHNNGTLESLFSEVDSKLAVPVAHNVSNILIGDRV